MCKIFAITNMANVPVTPKLISVIKKQVTKTDNHGFGYSVLGQNNTLGGERTIRVNTFQAMRQANSPLNNKVENLPFVEKTNNVFGKLRDSAENPKSLIAHGRLSTNSVSLANTHPFYNGDVSLIHNGVVCDRSGLVKNKLKTDNDSEILLRYYEMEGIKTIEEHVTGYYAMAILNKTDGTLHIVRDDKAPLFIAWSATIDSYIIATKPEIIYLIAKGMKWKIDMPEAIKNNSYIVFSGNDIISNRTIVPCTSYAYSDEFYEKSSAALGSPMSMIPRYREEDIVRDGQFKDINSMTDSEFKIYNDGLNSDDAPFSVEEYSEYLARVDVMTDEEFELHIHSKEYDFYASYKKHA